MTEEDSKSGAGKTSRTNTQKPRLGHFKDPYVVRNALAGDYSGRILISEEELDALKAERRRLSSELLDREKEFQSAIEELRITFSQREASLQRELHEGLKRADSRERELVDRAKALDARRKEMEIDNEIVRAELVTLRTALEQQQAEYEEKRKQFMEEGNAKLKTKTVGFVSSVVTQLDTRQSSMERVSLAWSLLAGISLFGGLILIASLSYLTYDSINSAMNWPTVSYYALKGSILLGSVAILARYAFLQSSNYMQEALRTTDRIHAIRFGQLYVETYGAGANWDEIKEAFQNWNGGSRADWRKSQAQEDPNPNLVIDLAGKVVDRFSQKAN